MHICVVSPSFPTVKTIDFVFVEQLCRAFADCGQQVTIIAPQSVTRCLMRGVPFAKKHSSFITSKGNKLELYRPYYISVSNHSIGGLFKDSFNQAVKRAFNSLSYRPDICYGHFWQSVSAIYPLAQQAGIPLIASSGEENVSKYVHIDEKSMSDMRDYISAAISVSSKNREECINCGLITEEKSTVIPNAIDATLFRVLKKKELRKKMNMSDSDFIVAFVGQFVERKGVQKLSEALTLLCDTEIKAMFFGRGPVEPNYKYIIKKGTTPHDHLPEYLNCADVFVLPTNNEGCSNAIIEAMACGLPIISTDAPFNYDILDDSNSIMIDCNNVEQIASAIQTLKADNELRTRLAIGARAKAASLTIDKRAERIIDIMRQSITNK